MNLFATPFFITCQPEKLFSNTKIFLKTRIVNFKIKHSLLLLLPLIIVLFANSSIKAQAPTITTSIGMPNGANPSARGIAYGNGFYISILNSGSIYKATDGESWTKVPSNPAGIFNGVAFGAGVFVIVGQSGQIITSADGLTWTTRTSGTTEYFNDVRFLQSAFYAIGNNATVKKSTDGITWTTITFGVGSATDQLRNITYGAGVFAISTATGGNSYVYRSATAASNTWTYQLVATGKFVNKVQYLKNKFFVFTSATDVYTSTDAITWTNSTSSMIVTLPNATTQTIGIPNQVFEGVYDGAKIFLFGYSGYYVSYGAVYSSTDGTNYVLEPQSAIVSGASAAYVNSKYFQLGNEGIITSTNGSIYKFLNGSYSAMATSGTSFVGVGTNGTGLIFSSTDYATWTDRTPSSQKELYGVVHTGTKYVAAGKNTIVESTNDGVTWSQIATPAYNFNTLAYGSAKYVAAGVNTPGSAARIAYSTNGTTWTDANTNDNYYFKVKFVNGNFFALGYSNTTSQGKIMYSTNGTSWSDITPTLAFPVYYFNDVVFDGTKYHFMGMEYANLATYTYDDFFSVSTATVTNPASFLNKGTITSPPGGALLGGTYGEGAFAYSNGRYVGSVNDINTQKTYIIYSLNGTSWTNTPIEATTIIGGASVVDNTFRFLGSGDGKITVAWATSALPVNLVQFNAALVNKQVELNWQTASEQNSRDFTIQYSANGTSWISLATIPAAGNSNTIRNYSYTHIAPAAGNNSYRILQTDLDGKVVYSEIRLVKINSKNPSVIVVGNPVVNGKLNMQVLNKTTVALYAADGRLLLNRQFNPGLQSVDVSQLSKGVYLLKAENVSQNIVIH